MNPSNPSNSLNNVLPLCRAAVRQLDHLTAKLQNRYTAILRKTAALQHLTRNPKLVTVSPNIPIFHHSIIPFFRLSKGLRR